VGGRRRLPVGGRSALLRCGLLSRGGLWSRRHLFLAAFYVWSKGRGAERLGTGGADDDTERVVNAHYIWRHNREG